MVVNLKAGHSHARAVLVVDDEVLTRMTISRQLRGCGYTVIEAANADEALVVLGQRPIELNIVLTDIEMPGSMDGFGLAAWVRQNRPELEVILAGTLPRAVDAAVKLCESGPIPGRYERQSLLGLIKRLMATRAARRLTAGWRGLTTRMLVS
ncbi:MAG TPA: response regulator [Xanthobacteraceae bacterium]